MKKTDRFLAVIVAAVVLLVIVAFVALLRAPEAGYHPDDSPQSAAYNYLLALHQRDDGRAYQYLSPGLAGYPKDAAQFSRQVRSAWWVENLQDDAPAAFKVLDANLTGDQAELSMQVTRFHQGGLFGSGQTSDTFKMLLEREAASNAWKITRSDNYWLVCWEDPAIICK